MPEVLASFVERRAPNMTDEFLTDLIIDIRTGMFDLTDEQITIISAEVMRRGSEEISELHPSMQGDDC
ncbi:hypothetical protein H0X10_02035 [Candidatus Saccharibacteria bacterium]|nr:hypothetical protein [Candidatus Saccharibacteria bacterium]